MEKGIDPPKNGRSLEEKTCSDCGKTKPTEGNFYFSKRDGWTTKCIACIRGRIREWGEVNPERLRETNRRNLRKNRDPESHRAKERLRYKADPERARALRRSWYNENLERARESTRRSHAKLEFIEKQRPKARLRAAERRGLRGGKVTEQRWALILAAFDHSCCYCNRSDLPLSLEHLTPVRRGGTNDNGNLAPACLPCNQSKGKRTAEEFCADRAAEIRRRALLCEETLLAA